MVQVRKSLRRPLSPRQAAARRSPLDALLVPDWFKALADPTRLRILACLIKCGRPCAVGEIAACCSVDLSVVSRHLQTLGRAGLLDCTRRGRTVRYGVRYGEVCCTLRRLAEAIDRCCPASGPGRCGGGACGPA